MNLDQIGMVEHLRDAEFVLRLKQEFLMLFRLDGDDLERILFAVSGAADVQNGAMRPRPQVAEDLESADAAYRVGHENEPGVPLGKPCATVAHLTKRVWGGVVVRP